MCMSMSRREFGQTLAAAAVSMSVQPDGVSAQPRSAGEELWMPVGLQIVGRHRADSSVLQLAYAFEQATGHGRRRPAL